MDTFIIRSEAKARRLTQYFTGIPCKNGHLTYRYTASGACAGCIREHNRPIEGSVMSVRRQLREEFVQKRFRLYESDAGVFGAAVWAMSAELVQAISLPDVTLNISPTDRTAGTGMYAFLCHPSHIEELQTIANGMMRAHMDVTDEQLAKARLEFIELGGDPDAP